MAYPIRLAVLRPGSIAAVSAACIALTTLAGPAVAPATATTARGAIQTTASVIAGQSDLALITGPITVSP